MPSPKRKASSTKRKPQPSKFYFDKAAADRAQLFFEGELQHCKGEWNGHPFVLAKWQREQIVRPLFGWKKRADQTRKYSTAYIEIPKKNGKSHLGAGLALLLLFGDGEAGAEIYSAAADREQASIVFNIAKSMIRKNPNLAERAQIFEASKTIVYNESIYKVLSAEAYTKHGYNISGLIFDELHAQPNRELFDTLSGGMASRRQPLNVMITTAGWNRASICFEQHEYALKVRDKIIVDETFLPVIYGAEEHDDWRSVKTWKKANPGYGVSVKQAFLKTQCEKAKEVPAYQNIFRRLHLNQWTSQTTRCIDRAKWDACGLTTVNERLLEGELCYGGLDMASREDLCALVLAFLHPEDEHQVVLVSRFWIPEATVDARAQKTGVGFDAWVRDGWITATPGEQIDQAIVVRDILALAARFNIKELAFDPFGMLWARHELEVQGNLTMIEMSQTMRMMSPGTKEILARIGDRTVLHNNHPVLTFCADNLAVRTDGDGNMRPDKRKSSEKIDGLVAAIMAVDRLTRRVQTEASVYDERGVLTL